MAREARLSASEMLSAAGLLDRLSEQALQSGSAVSTELEASWYDLERRLLLALRAEERAESAAGTKPLHELRAIAGNERIRNAVWEVTISLELRSACVNAMHKLAQLLRARASLAARAGIADLPPRHAS